MSLSEVAPASGLSRARRFAAGVTGSLLVLAALSGCTVAPLYGNSGALSPQANNATTAALASIAVTQAGDRVGQEVRNHLIFLLAGGAGQPASPVYQLQLSTSSHISQAPSVSATEVTLRPTTGFVALRGNYTLVEIATGRVISAGTRTVQAPYDIPGQNFAAQRAVRDAENRGARELAEMLRLAIAQEMQRSTSTAIPDVVTTPEDVDARRNAEIGSFPRRP